ncbi:Heat shock 70 kDa protein 15 [Forsythia ovata]|uniref:Heat shock 70 kDa protein 15 n=1 Tax=Forsythia ovata TaxID=205694 RepID=A0ABD1VM31_9LAMI
MALQDRVMEETKDKKNVVEAYVYDMRNKQGDPVEERYKEHTRRGYVIDQLVYCINSYRDAAKSPDPKFDHIDLAEKQKVLNECIGAEAWLREKIQQHDGLPKHATRVLLSADIRKKAEALDRYILIVTPIGKNRFNKNGPTKTFSDRLRDCKK